ncbi:KOW-like protein [Artemisia annua]|uniref:Transcription elongation factor SPT5 n=1 Tax=Artemisia annua TaxID=35608 RepID=A0A2U1LLS8_ARTAN|nr:KOW-like protein [Artemisia annua]
MPQRRDEYDPENVEDEDQVDAIDEDEDDYGTSRGGFIVNERDDHDAEDARRMRYPNLLTHEDEQEDQALLPSVRDPKLWMVKCAIGHEREVALCLMKKCIDKAAEMKIRSAIALDHLKNYIYIEADKEAHVREACKGMRYIFTGSKILLVPIKEMTDVLSVESKAIDISRDTWVRMKLGTYKGDLAKVVDVDNVRQRVTVKLIPRIDLQALANKLEGREVQKKKTFTPPPRFMNVDVARDMNIRVERRRDKKTGDYFENINGMMFKDGFLYKTVSIKSIRTQNIQPSFDELVKFQQPNEDGDGDIESLSTLFANRKKGHFMKGDRVIIIKGDLKNLKGCVEKVEESTVHIKPNATDLPKTLAVSERDLCKYFEPGNHVKVVSGAQEGVTGMVISVEGHLVNIVSDTTKEALRVFSDNVVESSEVTSGITKIGDFELHDLVQLDNSNFGVIIRVDNEAFQVLKGVADRAEVQLVRLRDIKYKIDRKASAQDRYKNTVSAKDVVKVIDGPCKASSTGRQGSVEHIYRGILVIYDRHHMEHAGFICTKSQSCILVGGSRASGDRNGNPLASTVAQLRIPSRFPNFPGRSPARGVPPPSGGRHIGGGRGRDSLAGTSVKIRLGPWKGYKGRVVDASGTTVRIELESQMKVVTDRAEVELVRLRDIKYKIDRKASAQDRYKNTVSVKDVVKVIDGPCKASSTGRQGSVEHIYRGILVIYDRHHMEHAGFICTKSQSCILVGGSRANGDRNGNPLASTVAQLRTPSRFPNFPGRSPARGVPPPSGGRHIGGGRGRDSLAGTSVKIRLGPWKGYKGRVVDASGTTVRIELESQMKVVTVDRTHISDIVNATTTTPYRDTHRYGSGSETPMHPSRTPLHPYMTPMRDSGATPVHDGMRTPMRDRAWNPYTPMSPPGTPMQPSRTPLHPYMTPMRDSGATPVHDGMRTPMRDRAWNPYTPMSPPGGTCIVAFLKEEAKW